MCPVQPCTRIKNCLTLDIQQEIRPCVAHPNTDCPELCRTVEAAPVYKAAQEVGAETCAAGCEVGQVQWQWGLGLRSSDDDEANALRLHLSKEITEP